MTLSRNPVPEYDTPPPKFIGGYVLYLDIDGVLHPADIYLQRGKPPAILDHTGHRLFEHATLLEDLLQPYPSLRIVLSSSWIKRYRGSLHKVGGYLTPSLRERIVGSTYHSRMLADNAYFCSTRGMQIWLDVVRRRPLGWLAIDDDYSGWPTWCMDRLVKTDSVMGISAPKVLSELRRKLAAMYAK